MSDIIETISICVGVGFGTGALTWVGIRLAKLYDRRAADVERAINEAHLTPEEQTMIRGAEKLNEVMPVKVPEHDARHAALKHVLWRRQIINEHRSRNMGNGIPT